MDDIENMIGCWGAYKEDALDILNKKLEIDPDNIAALQHKGSVLNNLGKYQEAVTNSDVVLKIDSKNLAALNSKGYALRKLHRDQKAIEIFDDILKIDPEDVPALNNKGCSLEVLGKHNEAIELYDQALAIDSKYLFALSNKGRSLNKIEKYVEALDAFDAVLKIDPVNMSALVNKVDVLKNLGRFQEALDISIFTLTWQGHSLYKLGKVNEAIETFDYVLKINPENIQALAYKEILLKDLRTSQTSIKLSTPVTESSNIIKKYAQYYYGLGLNVTCISNIKNEFNSKAENVYLKAPNHQWEDLWSRRQTQEELNYYQWSIATGLGLITGFNNLLAIDMDNCSRDFVIQTLETLGLPSDYEWVVLSGSRHGYHIYVFVDEILNVFPKISVVRLYPKEIYASLASKVELLIRLHSILPPSIHPTQNKYEFVNSSHPVMVPVHVGMDKIQNFINIYFDASRQENKKTYKKKKRSRIQKSEFQCPNKPHSWREVFFGCSLCKAEKERRDVENARELLEEREDRRIEMEQKKQDGWATYTVLEKEIRAMPRYAVWRKDVLARYNGKCAVGGLECTKVIEVDHFPRSLYSIVKRCGINNTMQAYECVELWDVNNGAVLCTYHHGLTTSSRYRAAQS